MADETQAPQVGWQGDAVRDTITFKYIEASGLLVDHALDDPGVVADYDAWLDSGPTAPAILSQIAPDSENRVIIFTLTEPYEFFVEFTTRLFTATVALSWDTQRSEIRAASLARFRGAPTAALQWIGLILDKLREMRAATRH